MCNCITLIDTTFLIRRYFMPIIGVKDDITAGSPQALIVDVNPSVVRHPSGVVHRLRLSQPVDNTHRP